MRAVIRFVVSCLALGLAAACGPGTHAPVNPDTAPQATVDRFSAAAGHLMVRTASNGLPAANAPIDFDTGAPFYTQGLSPAGKAVKYYNFDVSSTTPAPIYVLFKSGSTTPVDGQLNVVDVIPGDPGYNDFWQVVKVTVPSSYQANSVTSLADLKNAGYPMETQDALVNCPIVPVGSTATQRLGSTDTGLHRGWYKGTVVSYFTFAEASLSLASGGVPVSPIYVTFKINPNQPGGGPASGFVTEAGSAQTHNVIATIPGDASYSPLWYVQVYDNASFASVRDLPTARAAQQLGPAGANVNCPVFSLAE